jgi:hypothetical protein
MKLKILVLIIIFPAILLQAQDKNSAYKYWFTWGGMFDGENLSGNISYSFSLGNNFYKIGYLVKDEFNPSPWGGGSFETADFNSISISIGKRFQSEWWQTTFFVGPAYVFGENDFPNGNNEKYDTIGLQTEMQILFRYADELGLGIGLWGNMNLNKSHVGININLTLGNGK